MVTDGSAAPAIVAVSGNPRAGSRTLTVARTLADLAADALGRPGAVRSLDLAEFAPQIFDPTSAAVAEALGVLAAAELAVIATPVYKASYTGLLKAFLDRYGPGGLEGVLAVPVVVSASPAHSFVAEHLLRPLLVELGAVVAIRSFAITESQLPELDAVGRAWLTTALPVLTRLMADQEPDGAA